MSTSAVGETIEEHGTVINKGKKRVRCNYCGKEVGSFNRLKHHLAAVGSDVTACIEVTLDVKSHMRDALLERKKERLLKEVGRIEHPELPLKRNFAPASSEQRRCLLKLTHRTSSVEGNGGTEINVGESSSVNQFCPKQSLEKGKNILGPDGITFSSCFTENTYTIVKEEVKDDAVYDNLKGIILHEEVKDVLQHVEDVKQSWGRTGCSILLDGWTDQRGRSLLSFIVNCPVGTIFLRSVDASNAVQDVCSLFLLISNVIEEVGAQYIVQVVAHETSDCWEAAGKEIMKKYPSILWTLCADYCINLILEKIEVLEHVKRVLSDAKAITRFIYSNALLLKMLKTHMQGRDLVRTSNLKSVAPFITLQNMVSERENLISMFNSSTWNASDWASKTKGQSISKLVKDSSFWAAAVDVLKVTNPIVGILHQISGKDRSPMGFLYDSMDCAKEDIKGNLGGEEASYNLIWTLVDDIWDGYLHSPLHSIAYYLNPGFFYSSDFYVDAEVTNGIVYCFSKMTKNQRQEELICLQFDDYRQAKGGFSEETAVDQRRKVSPDVWWSLYGEHCPELQRLAVKILSQTCSGASRYMLRKGISELLHSEGRNYMEQQKFRDLEFVYYNYYLWRSPSCLNREVEFYPDELKPLDEWIVAN